MSLIKLSQPDGPYSAEIDAGVMAVEIRKAFLGVRFITEDGATLSVSMRDGGFEIVHGRETDTQSQGSST